MNELSLFALAENAIIQHNMLRDADSVLVALSGGSDSVALLHFLSRVREKYGVRLYAAHVNHMIRGEEADRDEDFVRQLCSSLGITLHVGRFDVPGLSEKEGTGLEETARKYRYRFLSGLCSDFGISRTATAHTRSDSTETVLFNLVRGTGLSGLKGIPPVRDNIVRPLIYCTKRDVLDYCRANGLDYITDSTNLCPDYTRNYLRLEVLPLLDRINPSLDGAVSRISELAAQDSDCLDALAADFIRENAAQGGVDITGLLSLHPALSSRAVMEMYAAASGGVLESVHVADVMRLAHKGKTGSRISLPNGFEAIAEYGKLYIRKRGEAPAEFSKLLNIGSNYVDIIQKKVTLSVCTIDNTQKNVYNLFNSIYADYGKIVGNITVRNRRDGDSYVFGGHTRTLKKIMIDRKIPRGRRSLIPVFEDEAGIIAVEGLPVCDRVRISSGTEAVLEICIHETD